MAEAIVLNLSRRDQSQPWGFRLQGGKDFASPLSVQKVNAGSIAETAGLQVGDCILRVGQDDVLHLRHAEALEIIKKAGNAFELVVCRGGIWKPQVTPLAEPVECNGDLLFRKTSLAANKQEVHHIGSAHNTRAAPFQSPKVTQEPSAGAKLANKQYNSPVGLYNEQTIAETLAAQTEVLAQGVLGVNFKKNEKTYDASSSSVFKALQEFDSDPKQPDATTENQDVPVAAPGVTTLPAGMRKVSAPVTKPASETSAQPALQTRCAECDRFIVGVFVRVKDRNLHVECFKCTICGTSLKNIGYYNIGDKLYCDIHARQVARHQAPAPNLDPVTVNPGAPIPSGAFPAETARSQSAQNQKANLPSFLASAMGSTNPPPVGGIRIFPPNPNTMEISSSTKVEQSEFSETKTKFSSSSLSAVSSSTVESFSSTTTSTKIL